MSWDDDIREFARARDELVAAVREAWPFRYGIGTSLVAWIGLAFVIAGAAVVIGGPTAMQAWAASMCILLGVVLIAVAWDFTR